MVHVLRITGPGQVEAGTPFQLWGLPDSLTDYLATFHTPPGQPAQAGGQSVAFSPEGGRAYLVQNGTFLWENTSGDPNNPVWDLLEDPPNQLSWLRITGPGTAAAGGVWVADLPANDSGGLFGVDVLALTPDGTNALVGNPSGIFSSLCEDMGFVPPCASKNVALVRLDTFAVSSAETDSIGPVGIDVFDVPPPQPLPGLSPWGIVALIFLAGVCAIFRLRKRKA
jgi:hypothetical protein